MSFKKALSVTSRALTSSRPYHVQWMVTRKCNYRCKGCNVWREQDAKELSAAEIKKGLDILKKLGVMEIVISGGNPLLREDIDEIIEYASRYFITTVYDNGSMAAEKVDALRNADFVAISIDSLDSDKHDYLKGVKGAWERAMHAVEKLRNEGVIVAVTPTISQINLYEIIDVTKFFTEKGVPVWYCLYSYDFSDSASLFGIGRENDEFVIVDRDAMAKLCDSLIEMKKKDGRILMTTEVLKAIKRLYLEGERTWNCRALQNFFVINHLGQVAGCHLHNSVTSIFDLPIVWNSAEFNSLRKTYSACDRCTYLCYMFYSIHGGVIGNLKIAQEHWKSAKLFWREGASKPLCLVEKK
ncbi:MAG: radical SAM protein [Candidatus Bathyarchaeia archaeon]